MTEGDTSRTHTPPGGDATEFLARCPRDSGTSPLESEGVSPPPVHVLVHCLADVWR
ncbi:hypothetical protein GCM10023199_10980 [Actinomycetospora chibensis]